MNRNLIHEAIVAGIILSCIVALATAFLPTETPPDQQDFGVSTGSGIAVFETSLQDRILSSDTSMTLVSASTTSGEDVAGYQCFTIDEGSTLLEYVCGTAQGKTVSSLERGISFINGTTTSAGRASPHRKGASVKITDYPMLQRLRNQNNGLETFPNLMAYANTVLIGVGSPTTTIASKYYVDQTSVAGAANSDTSTKGIVELATQAEAASSTSIGSTLAALVLPSSMATDTPGTGTRTSRVVMSDLTGYIRWAWLNLTEAVSVSGLWTFSGGLTATATTTLSATTSLSSRTIGDGALVGIVASTTFTGAAVPQPVFVATSTGTLFLSDANVSTTSDFVGFVVTNTSAGGTAYVQTAGQVSGFTGLTPGAPYYVQDAVGTIGTSIGTSEVFVGQAVSSTTISIEPASYRHGMEYVSSSAFSVSSGSATTTQPNFARMAVIYAGISGTIGNATELTLFKVGKTTGTYAFDGINAGDDGAYSFVWGTDGIRLTEDSDPASDASLSGTIYWYR